MKKIKFIGLFTAALFTAGFVFADDFDFGDDFGSDFGGDFGDSSASFAGGALEVNGEAQIDFRAYFEDEGADSDADIAVLAVKLSDIPEDTLNAISVATIDNSDDVKVGQGVMAIGNALGLGQTTTFGHVSALNKDVTTSDDNVTRSMMQE